MAEIVAAVYEKGVLRPLQPINLREYQKVRVQVLLEEAPVHIGQESKIADVLQSLVASGLMRPKPSRISLPPDPVSEAERLRLAVAQAEDLLIENPNHYPNARDAGTQVRRDEIG